MSDVVRSPAKHHDRLGRQLAWYGLDLRDGVALEIGDPEGSLPGLHEIPTETSNQERSFLFSYFARLWPGTGHVVEIGPFFGGTTRAIALGMLINPRRAPGARLFTFDRFEDYYDPDDLAGRFAGHPNTTVQSLLDEELFRRRGNFRQIFDALHDGTPYEHLVVAEQTSLPDTPEAASADDVFHLEVEADAFFVDGCKSWSATRHLLQEVARVGRPGTHLIFQDYGWWGCFYIPAALYALRDHLSPFASVDWTRAFQVDRPLELGEVERLLPETPTQAGRAYFDQAFDALHGEARASGSLRAGLQYGLQHAVALASVGHVDEALERVRGLWRDHRFSSGRAVTEETLRWLQERQ